ncbi:MAG: glycosyltransferase family 87 protein [Promethearchaeia archaeon]
MKIKEKITNLSHIFSNLWQKKSVKSAILVHLFYFFLSITLLFLFFRKNNDFIVYYRAGGLFLENITELYNLEHYLWQFRYFPLAAVFFIPYYLLGFELGFIVFHITNLFLNYLTVLLMYKIILYVKKQDKEQRRDQLILYISLFLMGLPQMFNYVLGQINLFVTTLMLLSLYIFLKYDDMLWNLKGALTLGASFVIKPTLIFIVPFLAVIKLNSGNKKCNINIKTSLIRILGSLVPLLSNLILFILIPELWEGFLRMNLTRASLVEMNHSFSITRNVINVLLLFGVFNSSLLILLTILFVVGGIAFLIYIFGDFGKNRLIFGYLLGLIVLLLSYFDSWNHHLVTFLPLLIILILTLPHNSKISSNYFKPAFFFLNFLDLAFMGIWFIIYPVFPFHCTTTFFLIVILIGIGKFGVNRKNKTYKNDAKE